MIYVTSDLHFCHNRDFVYRPRGFGTVQEMNRAIVENWNNVVAPDDDVYVLGDIMLNDNAEGARLFKNLKGQIHIVLGNHDTEERIGLYHHFYNVVEVEYGLPLKYNGYRFYLSHYPTLSARDDEAKPLKKQRINLCGHTHTSDKFYDWDKGRIYHVELDAHGCTPVSLDKIIADIEEKAI